MKVLRSLTGGLSVSLVLLLANSAAASPENWLEWVFEYFKQCICGGGFPW